MAKTKFTTSDLEDLETYKNEYGEDKIKSTLKSRGFSDTFKNIATNTIDTPNTPEIEKTEIPNVKGYEQGQVKIPGVNTISPIKIPGKTDPILAPEQLEKPDLTSTAKPQKEQTPMGISEKPTIEQIKPNISTGVTDAGQTDTGTTTSIQTTGISEIDDALSKLRTEKTENISETIKNYNIAKGQFEEYKGNYTNFDTINNTFEGVLNDMQVIQETGVPLTEQDYQNIANKYGLEVSDIKNPTNIFNSLQLSEEGKINTGVTDAELQIDGLTTDFNRNKEDLQDNIETQKTNLFSQLDTAQQQLEQSTQWMNAYGAWTGAGKSSGYAQGIENIKQDGEKTLNSIESLLQNVEITGQENIKRLTDDYNTAITGAKTELDSNIKELNNNAGLELNTAMLKYDKSDEQLTKALDAINEEFGTASMDVFSQYISNLRSINDYTSSATENAFNEYTLGKEMSDSRYNEYVANDGQLLQNTNLDTLIQEYSIGNITAQRFQDLQNTMITGITGILSNVAVPDEEDLTEIKQYLSNGMTPTEIIGEMAKKDKFADIEETEIDEPNIEIIGYDEDGNAIRGTYNQTTRKYEPITIGAGDTFTGDFNTLDFTENTDLINKYTGEASFKNNNPTGMTWGISDNLKGLFEDAGINYGIGSDRPTEEGGNYIKFNSVQDGLDAYAVALTQGGSDDIYSRLVTWVGTDNGDNYANDLMNLSGIEKGTKFSELSEDQLTSLLENQLERESPNFYKEISNITPEVTEEITTEFDTTSIPQFSNYLTSGVIGTEATIKTIQEQFGSVEEFKKQAELYNNSENGPKQKEIKKIETLRDTLAGFLSDENKEAIDDTTGVIKTAMPWDTLEKNAFLGEIQNFLDKQTLQNLIDVKAEGATFGALSNEELRMLQNAASTISSLAIHEDDDIAKPITGFKGGTENFKDELQKLLNTYEETINGKKKEMGTIYTDDDGVDYDMDSLKNEVTRMIQDGEATADETKQWLINNNITLQ